MLNKVTEQGNVNIMPYRPHDIETNYMLSDVTRTLPMCAEYYSLWYMRQPVCMLYLQARSFMSPIYSV